MAFFTETNNHLYLLLSPTFGFFTPSSSSEYCEYQSCHIHETFNTIDDRAEGDDDIDGDTDEDQDDDSDPKVCEDLRALPKVHIRYTSSSLLCHCKLTIVTYI